MNPTPILTFLQDTIQKDLHRWFMPGHKGSLPSLFSSLAPYDITEILGADYLYEPTGIIQESEGIASETFDTGTSLFSVNGSSHCIFAMLHFAAKTGTEILIQRNCHISVIHGLSLLQIPVSFLMNHKDPSSGLSLPISPFQVEEALQKNPNISHLFLTSIDYFGQMTDLASISKCCKKHQVTLLVDNAHGPLLHFLSPSLHPIQLGADFCCDSLHKTLGALTGTALLHGKNPQHYHSLKHSMKLIGSTSPSYLLMLSIEQCIFQLNQKDMKQETLSLMKKNQELLDWAESLGYHILKGTLPLRVCLSSCPLGYTGEEFAELLRQQHIEPELVTPSFVVLLPSYATPASQYQHLKETLSSIPPKKPKTIPMQPIPSPIFHTSISYALSKEYEVKPLAHTLGHILAETVYQFPPGIPYTIPGEIMTESLLEILKNSGIQEIKVVK